MKLCLVILFLGVTLITGQADRDWWETASIYHVYPASFRDTNGDGLGDLKGITEKLDYIKSLGVDAIWLSPIFETPFLGSGYDISDYKEIDWRFGTMADFDELMAQANLLGLKVVLDIVPNHSSWDHPWFKKSIARDPEYDNYYIWHPGVIDQATGQRRPPSNWINLSRVSGWEWNEERGEYYWNQFHANMPDLNFRNDNVHREFDSIFEFWMDKGVYGFRIDAISFLYEAKADETTGLFPDEPETGNDDPWDNLWHIHTQDLDETFEKVYDFRSYLDDYQARHPGSEYRLLMTESYSGIDVLRRFFGNDFRDGSNVPFYFEPMFRTSRNSNAHDLKSIIDHFMGTIPWPTRFIPNWVIGNHDQSRIGQRAGVEKIDLMTVFQMTLPGVSVTYNGEEIGMVDTCMQFPEGRNPILCEEQVFEYFRDDFARSPMQWDGTKNAGFSSSDDPWKPAHPNYPQNNVQTQDGNEGSHLSIYRSLIAFRKKYETLRSGYIETKVLNEFGWLFGNVRYREGLRSFVVLINTGPYTEPTNLIGQFEHLNSDMEVLLAPQHSVFNVGQVVYLGDISLGPYEFLILESF